MLLIFTILCSIICAHIWASFLYKPYGFAVAKWFGMSHNDYVEFFTLATLCSPVTMPLFTTFLWYILYLTKAK